MLSGSGNNGSRGVVLGASTTAAGVATLPNTGGRNWLMYTALATTLIGVLMVALKLVVAFETHRK